MSHSHGCTVLATMRNQTAVLGRKEIVLVLLGCFGALNKRELEGFVTRRNATVFTFSCRFVVTRTHASPFVQSMLILKLLMSEPASARICSALILLIPGITSSAWIAAM